MKKTVDRWFFVKTQLMRVHMVIEGKNWMLEGIPADKPAEGDEVVRNQKAVFQVYEQYGLYKIGVIDIIMTPMENILGRWINSRRQRKPWKNAGTFE